MKHRVRRFPARSEPWEDPETGETGTTTFVTVEVAHGHDDLYQVQHLTVRPDANSEEIETIYQLAEQAAFRVLDRCVECLELWHQQRFADERKELAELIHKRVNSSRVRGTVPFLVGDAERAVSAVLEAGWVPNKARSWE